MKQYANKSVKMETDFFTTFWQNSIVLIYKFKTVKFIQTNKKVYTKFFAINFMILCIYISDKSPQNLRKA